VEVLISRASIKQQMKGNRMKKKPVMKKNIGKILKETSPVFGTLTGKGGMGALASSGALGALPAAIARPKRKKAKMKKAARMSASSPQMQPSSPSAGMGMTEMTRRMAMGGEIKRTKPIDGIAMKGKTRAI
tara:strand:+ start:159 stop:551 length:393 start_codon:yes stop_codon:yes gene_type:complete